MNTHILKAVFVINFCYLQFQFLAFSPHKCNSVCLYPFKKQISLWKSCSQHTSYISRLRGILDKMAFIGQRACLKICIVLPCAEASGKCFLITFSLSDLQNFHFPVIWRI